MKPEFDATPQDGARKKKTLPDFSSWVRELFKASEDSATSKPLLSAPEPKPAPGLYIVATPIGNLGDITLRSLWLMQQADLILCEDTRVTGNLLHLYGLSVPLLTYHDHNEAARVEEVCQKIAEGAVIVQVSDAGTPLLSDPGFKLVQACRARGLPVTAAPGASALLTALACAGLPTDCFSFIGFLPTKKMARQKELAALASLPGTLIFYESPQRVADTLADMVEVFSGTRPAVVARELTKLYEEVRNDSLAMLAESFKHQADIKGEFVILVSPADKKVEGCSEEQLDALLQKTLQTMSLRDAVAAVVEATGLKKSVVYQRALQLLPS